MIIFFLSLFFLVIFDINFECEIYILSFSLLEINHNIKLLACLSEIIRLYYLFTLYFGPKTSSLSLSRMKL